MKSESSIVSKNLLFEREKSVKHVKTRPASLQDFSDSPRAHTWSPAWRSRLAQLHENKTFFALPRATLSLCQRMSARDVHHQQHRFTRFKIFSPRYSISLATGPFTSHEALSVSTEPPSSILFIPRGVAYHLSNTI